MVTRGNIVAHHSLALILPQDLLIVLVRDLEPIPCDEQVQMEYIFDVRLIVDAGEERTIIADGVEWYELRRVEKTAGSRSARSQKIAELLRPEPESYGLFCRSTMESGSNSRVAARKMLFSRPSKVLRCHGMLNT